MVFQLSHRKLQVKHKKRRISEKGDLRLAPD